MKKTFYLLFALMMIIMGFGGCNGEIQSSSSPSETLSSSNISENINAASSNADSSIAVSSNAAASLNADETTDRTPKNTDSNVSDGIHVALATDELLSQYSSFNEYTQDENGDSLIIWTEIEIKNSTLTK